MEIGGKIALESRPAPERGAILTIDFPEFVVVHQDTPSEELQDEEVNA